MLYYIGFGLGRWFGQNTLKKIEKYACSGGRVRGSKILVGPVGVFLTYSGELYSHIV